MTGLRERRRERTAATIHRAAVDLVFELGLDETTTEKISEKAGISPRTFFNYFPYKEAALMPPEQNFPPEAVRKFENGTKTLLDDLADLMIPFSEPYGQNRPLLRKLFKLADSHPKLILFKIKAFQDFDEKLTKVIALRINDDQKRSQIIGASIAAAMRVSFEQWVEGDFETAEGSIRHCIAELKTAFSE